MQFLIMETTKKLLVFVLSFCDVRFEARLSLSFKLHFIRRVSAMLTHSWKLQFSVFTWKFIVE